MPDPYQELDVFGRPKSHVDGVPYVAFDDDLAALQNYVMNLRAKEEAIESGARTPRRVKEIVREGGRLPGYVHPYEPGYVVQEQERLRDETDPVQFLPIVRQGVENVRAIANEGPETPEYIDAKLFGQRAPQYLNTLGSQVRKGGPGFEARFGEWQDPWVTGGDPALRGSLTGRTQMWPEKMARSGAALPGDVMSGRVMTGPGLRSTDFSDIPGAPNPLAPLIERTQDLAGMAMGGSIPELAARGAKPVPVSQELSKGNAAIQSFIDGSVKNAWVDVPEGKMYLRQSRHPRLGPVLDVANIDFETKGTGAFTKYLSHIEDQVKSNDKFNGIRVENIFNKRLESFLERKGFVRDGMSDPPTMVMPKSRLNILRADDEVGGAVGASRNALKDLTQGSFGGNVPPSIARNIGRETMPEILARQRASEGYEAAIRDPETKKLYTGMWHEEVLDKIAKDKGMPKDQLPTNLVKGYVNDRGRFLTEEAVERMSQNRSKTAMFRADDEVGAAVAAMHAAEGKPSRVPMSKYSQTKGNFDHLVAVVEKNLNKNGGIPLKNVKVSELRGTQERLSDFGGGDPVFEELNDHPVVVEDKHGEKVLIDGHHRVNGAINDKVSSIPVHYIKLSADDEVGGAISAAKNATRAPELKVGQANLPATIPQGGLPAPGTALNPISNRRGFLRGARDLMAAASNANKVVSMAEKLGHTPIPKNPKVPLKEIWKTENEIPPYVHDQALDNFWEGFVDDFHEQYPKFGKNFDESTATPAQLKAYNKAREKFEKEHAESIDDITAEAFANWQEDEGGGTQFSHHQLPGATNYREHLIQMPGENPAVLKARTDRVNELNIKIAKRRKQLTGKDEKNDKVLQGLHAELDRQHVAPLYDRFYGDWNEPDIIGHSRVNDRQIPGVGRALHIEEIGSQLHEKGAKEGYGKVDTSKWTVKDEGKNRIVKNQDGVTRGIFGKELSVKDAMAKAAERDVPVPDLPFKKTYADLAVNRMLHEAATQGYDAVSWTPHEIAGRAYNEGGTKEAHARVEALAKKYGGKIEKKPIDDVLLIDKRGEGIKGDESTKGNFYNVFVKGYDGGSGGDLVKRFGTLKEAEDFVKENSYANVLKLTPEMKRIFGHDDFSFFPKPEAGEGFKLRSDSEAGAAIGALRNSVAPTFYSGLSRTIGRAPFETATPSQWMKHLRDTVGARQAEEFEHVGLEDRLGPLAEVKAPVERKAQGQLETWKAANKGQRPPKELTDAASNENKRIVEQRLAEKGNEKPLTKAKLLTHVAGNQPKFKEIVKRGNQDDSEAAIHRRAEEIIDEQQIHPDHPRYADYFAEATHQAEDELINSGQQAKYSDYQLPGGTNYREHLMTMPKKDQVLVAKRYIELQNIARRRNITEAEHEEMTALERAMQGRNHPQADEHHSSHWDEPNVIVHTRMNDRDLGGDRSLHAEEFQSDLHQEGRKQGYAGPITVTQRKLTPEEARQANIDPEHAERGKVYVAERNGKMLGVGASPEEAKMYANTHKAGVPNFPFKKSWPDLAIKRWLREATDNDYDAVSWTPGEAQRDRFQLGHTIENLFYDKASDGTYSVDAKTKNGQTHLVNRGLPIKESELSQHFGDAVAEKIKKGEGKHQEGGGRVLENQDLKVGGEGLVSFYDKTIKGKVEALVERFGGKVEKHKINQTPEEKRSQEINKRIGELRAEMSRDAHVRKPHIWEELRQLVNERTELEQKVGRTLGNDTTGADFVWSVKLTSEMKRAIRSEGFPLFSAGPVMTPVDHDPFDKKQKPKPKLEPVEHDPFTQPTPDLGGTLNKLISATGGYRPRPRPIQNGFGRRQ